MTKEQERYNLQIFLDSQKSDKERNLLGQFSTPYPLAKDMVKNALSLPHEAQIRFLEPSIGTGVFFSALKDMINPVESLGFEIDKHYYNPTARLWEGYDLHLINADFLNYHPSPRFNLILANPPYSRHHHIDNNVKKELQSRILKEFNINISGLSGLYCYFLILSSLWLKEDGISSWLIPSEFLDVNYGSAVKEFLCSKVELISIHKFNPAELQFSDALVSSSIVTFRKKVPDGQNVRFSTGADLNNPATSIEIPVNDLDPKSKWNTLFDISNSLKGIKGKRLGDFFKVSRGIATGNNGFFIIPERIVSQNKFPLEYLRPILPAPRHLRVERIYPNLRNLNADERFYLLSCSLPIDLIESCYPTLYEYIKDGERRDVNSSYNCQRRAPWYSCEMRDSAPLYMTYMGRGENKDRMFRFILNESDSIVTNSYLMLYPRDSYKYCFNNKETVETVWNVLNCIPKDRLAKCGRTYGGGLFKIEPKELESLIVPELESILTPQQASLFEF